MELPPHANAAYDMLCASLFDLLKKRKEMGMQHVHSASSIACTYHTRDVDFTSTYQIMLA